MDEATAKAISEIMAVSRETNAIANAALSSTFALARLLGKSGQMDVETERHLTDHLRHLDEVLRSSEAAEMLASLHSSMRP